MTTSNKNPFNDLDKKFNTKAVTKALEKKPHPPGQHGRGRRRKKSEYAIQIAEKQKAK